MSTLSVPLTRELEYEVEHLVRRGVGASKAEVVRRAIKQLAEDEAVATVMRAEQEVREGKILRGNLKNLLKKLP